MEPVVRIASRTVVLAADNVDTDQIIPARFLTGTRTDGLGASLFADWRRDGAGELRPDFPLNRPEEDRCSGRARRERGQLRDGAGHG